VEKDLKDIYLNSKFNIQNSTLIIADGVFSTELEKVIQCYAV
jgi:hypothetical protein